MSSSDNEVSRWHPRHVREIAELLSPMVSPNNAHIFSPENPLLGIDQCMHIFGKADSAYSSFSGSSNLPDFSGSLGSSEHDLLPLKQVPYMDSGHIGGIRNPSVGNVERRQMYENKMVRKCNYRKLDSPAHTKSFGNKPTPGMLYQTASPLARLSPLLSPSPSPTAQVDDYKANRSVDETQAGICFRSNVQGETYMQEASQVLPLHTLQHCCNDCWLSISQNESPVTEKGVIWYPSKLNATKKSSTTSSTKHSILQGQLKSGSLAKKTQEMLTAQNTIHAYKIPEGMRAKPSLSLQTSHKPVNDPLENKQHLYACSVHKPPFGEADLTRTAAIPRKQEGPPYSVLDLFRVDDYSGFDHSISKSSKTLKCADNSVPNKATPGIINAYEDKDCTLCSEEENSRSIWQQPLKIPKLPSQALDSTESFSSEIYETSSSVSYFNHDAEEVASKLFNGLGKTEQNTASSTNLLTNPSQEEMLKPFGFPKLPFSKAESQPQNDSANIKINRKTTPLLYYLSGGRNSSFMNNKNQGQEHEDFVMKSPRNNHPGLAEAIEIPKDSNSYVDDTANKNEGSLDEKFKNDYREKLKVAQQKVLRETSFKRKDLQMSLPIRLKEKPSSRPSIQHLRSLSLSSTNEDSKLIPPPKPQETIYPEEESKKPQTVRIGGRKRATKEQKKMSYSEPDKLNQLDDQRDQSISWGRKNARSRSDEITGQDMRTIRSKALENQGRAISKAELKQLQHNALLEYMERKIGQQPAVAKNWSQPKLSSQLRILSSKRLPEDTTSNPSTTRKSQNMFFPFPASGRIHEPPSVFPTSTSTATTTDRCILRSLEFELLNSKAQPAISEESCNSKYVPAQSFLHSGSASSEARERSQSVPSPIQDCYRSIAFSALSSQDHGYYAAHHSFPVAEKEDSGDSEDSKKSIENSHSQEIELSLFSKEKSKNAQLKQEISENSEVFSVPGETQWQHREEEDTSGHSEDMTDNCTALLDNEGPKHLSQQLGNLKVLQNEDEHQFSLQDTALSIAQSKSQQDQKYDHLAVEVIAEDKSLVDILMSHPSRKTVYDLMEGLFPVNTSVSRKSHRRNWEIQSAQANDQRSNECGTDPYHGTMNDLGQRAEDDILHINQILIENRESLLDVDRITSKKKQLISSIQSTLQTLQDERELIQSEAMEHAAHGKVLESLVHDLCKPNEQERYLMFIGDLEKVVNLLLCLSTRLARIHNAMGKMDENTDAEEKQSLNERHRLLSGQQEDAKDLKENLDRRERVVSGLLSKYMTKNQLQDYKLFIQEKITLLIKQKDLEEHIKFLEEQLERLEKSIPP
ncbi:protein Shroom1 [Candoia aspera]|uniref:protein Shroom1 n=1 Tax=Candoia aspera TaxID=51853 RepID=UPI002FD7AB12